MDYIKAISEKKNEAKRLMTSEQFEKCGQAIVFGIMGNPSLLVLADLTSSNRVKMVIALGKVFNQRISGREAEKKISTVLKSIRVDGNIFTAVFPGAQKHSSEITELMGWIIAIDFARIRK